MLRRGLCLAGSLVAMAAAVGAVAPIGPDPALLVTDDDRPSATDAGNGLLLVAEMGKRAPAACRLCIFGSIRFRTMLVVDARRGRLVSGARVNAVRIADRARHPEGPTIDGPMSRLRLETYVHARGGGKAINRTTLVLGIDNIDICFCVYFPPKAARPTSSAYAKYLNSFLPSHTYTRRQPLSACIDM